MFEAIEQAPPDAILGLNEAFQNDARDDKINLTAGVYKDDNGVTPILKCVKQAERALLDEEDSKTYLGIDGLPSYRRAVPELLFGSGHDVVDQNRYATLQTPGGTGALRVAADFIANRFPQARIWCSQPTWANHPHIFRRAGLDLNTYRYLDDDGRRLDADGFLAALEQIPSGDAVCLHACCHNPTGVDPTADQWQTVASIIKDRELLPLVDCAYQGFGVGIDDDAAAIRLMAESGVDLLVCSSFSKNFSLYGERVGALTFVAADETTASRVLSQAKSCVRANYSNPPKHGAAIVAKILASQVLRSQWEDELAAMRDRIRQTREAFVTSLSRKAPDADFSHIANQNGMFSFSGLTKMQVDQLRTDFAIYIVGSGRINVAGITSSNLERLTDCIAEVL